MKFILRFIGIPLILVGMWYVIMLYIQTKGVNMFRYHLDLAAMIERFTKGKQEFDITSLLNTLDSYNKLLSRIGNIFPISKGINAIGNRAFGTATGSGLNFVVNFLQTILDPLFGITQAVVTIGYVLYGLFQLFMIVITLCQPFLILLFQPIWVM